MKKTVKKKVGASGAGGNGNTNKPPKANDKRIGPCKRWCFTWNNYDQYNLETLGDYNMFGWYLLLEYFSNNNITYIIGSEIGESGTIHLQGYIECNKKKRWSEFKLPIGIHWESTGGTREHNIIYCSKDLHYYCSYSLRPLKIITTLYKWQQDIVDLYDTEPDGQTVKWIYDEEGGHGKSSFCRYMYYHYKVPTIQGGKLADVINIIFNCDISKHKMLLIDVPRESKNNISYSAIECILNGMITNTKYETGTLVFNPPHVVVFCNYMHKETMSVRRWDVTTLE